MKGEALGSALERSSQGGAAPWLRVALSLPLGPFALEAHFEASATVTGVFGASGSGKTTLLEAVAGLRPAEGELRFKDERWVGGRRLLPPERRGLGYVPQDGCLFPHLTVRGNLLSARRCRGGPGPSWLRVVEALELGPLLDRSVAHLSGGERQRVALGRALSAEPRLLLLDEPLSALDRPRRRQLLPFLRRALAEAEVPTLYVSHDPTEMLALCERVVVLAGGRVVTEGAARAVLAEVASRAGGGHENVLPCCIEQVDGGTARVAVAEGLSLTGAWSHQGRVGLPRSSAYLVLPATDVLLAKERPAQISARNIVLGQVHAVRVEDTVAQIIVKLCRAEGGVTEVEVVAEVSRESAAELRLTPGAPVWAVFKARSCEVFAS